MRENLSTQCLVGSALARSTNCEDATVTGNRAATQPCSAPRMAFEGRTNREMSWQRLMELRRQREIVVRWLNCCELPPHLQEQLQIMLCDIERQLEHGEGPTDSLAGCKGRHRKACDENS